MASAPSRKIGILQISASGLCFGILGIVGKALFEKGATPGEVLGLRYSLAALALWPVLWTRMSGRWRLPARDLLLCAGLGIGGYALFSACFFMALQGLSASLAVLLLYTYPVLVTVFAWVFWGDRIPRGRWAALPLTLAGMGLMTWGQFSADRFSSIVLGLGSAFFYSLYILFSSRFLKRVHPLVSVTYILSFAALALDALYLRDPARVLQLVLNSWLLIAIMVGVSTVGAMSLFLAGLQKLRPWEASLLSTLEPVTGVALAALWLGERLSLAQQLGAAGVLGGLVLVSFPEGRRETVSDPSSRSLPMPDSSCD